jgi:hypothetical protein
MNYLRECQYKIELIGDRIETDVFGDEEARYDERVVGVM